MPSVENTDVVGIIYPPPEIRSIFFFFNIMKFIKNFLIKMLYLNLLYI